MSTPTQGYVAGGDEYLYPGLGDPKPPGGAKVLLLTRGGVCTIGQWPTHDPRGSILGWARLPSRNHEREASLHVY